MLLEVFSILTFVFTPFLQPTWTWLCHNTNEYSMFVCGCFLFQIFGYLLGCIPYVILDIFKPFSSTLEKIQPEKYPTKKDFVKSTLDILYSFSTVILPMLCVGGIIFPIFGITRDGPLPTPQTVLIQIIYFFLVEDYMNYWIHRWLHLPWLYKHIHSVHHEYNSPFSLVAAYAHPIEVILLGIPTFTGPLLITPHLYTLFIWQTFRNFEAIDIHSGYEFPYSIRNLFPSYAGTRHHDYHHYMHSGNFASVFTWCDRLYGTHLGYESFQKKKLQDNKTM